MAESVTEFDINDSPKSINDELFGVGMNRANQPQAHITIKTEPTDDELTAIDFNLIGQPTELKVIIKTEPIDHELSAVGIDEECQPTVQVVIKTEQPDKIQLSEISTECENVNYFHNEISEFSPHVLIETKPLDVAQVCAAETTQSVPALSVEYFKNESPHKAMSSVEANDDTIDTKIKSRPEVEIGEHDYQSCQNLNRKEIVDPIPKTYNSEYCNICKKVVNNLKRHIPIHQQQCYICYKTFKFTQNLRLHMHSHDLKSHVSKLPNTCTCEICSKSISKNSLAGHMRRHRLKPFMCTRCRKLFASADILKKHMEDCEKKSPQICEICNRVFLDAVSFKWHSDVVHNSSQQYKCSICSKMFLTQKNLTNHSKRHSKPGRIPRKCPVCSKPFLRLDYYKAHLQTHNQVEDFVFCNICRKRFESRRHLKKHMVSHERKTKTYWECSICLKWFTTKKYMNFHKANHLNRQKYPCIICNKELSLHISLHFHLYAHKEHLPLRCPVCSRELKWTDETRLKHHNRIANYCRCDICKKFFRKKEDLSMHLLEHYQTCKICNFVSKTPRIHQQHFLKHAREKLTKPYLCERCNKRFKNFQKLESHICVNGLPKNLLTTQNCSSVSSFHQITNITQSQEQSDHSLSVSDANFFKVGELFSLKTSAPNSTPGLPTVNLSPDSDLNISEAHALQVPFNSASNIALMNASKHSIASNSNSLRDCEVSTENAENIPTTSKPIQRTMCATSSQPFNNECSKPKRMAHQEMETEIEPQKGIGDASLVFLQEKGQNVKLKQAEVNSVNVACFTCKVCRKMYKYPLELKNHMKSSRHGYKLKTYYKC